MEGLTRSIVCVRSAPPAWAQGTRPAASAATIAKMMRAILLENAELGVAGLIRSHFTRLPLNCALAPEPGVPSHKRPVKVHPKVSAGLVPFHITRGVKS